MDEHPLDNDIGGDALGPRPPIDLLVKPAEDGERMGVGHPDHPPGAEGLVHRRDDRVMLNYYYSKSEEMFKGCSSLETLKTSAGLRTYVSVGDNHSFKIIKLKKGIPASVEKESQNFNEKYEINASGDQEVIYHIYRKDNFVGVTFDKNDRDTES